VEFKKVQTQRFKIHCLAQGMTEYVPVNFQDQYFSVLNCYLQSVLLDYRFRLPESKTSRHLPVKGEKPKGGSHKAEPHQSESVAHFFFSDEQGSLPSTLDLREVDLIYNDYIRVMTIMFEKLKNNYNTFAKRFLSEEERTKFNV